MHGPVQWILLGCAALVASTLAAVTGFGGADVPLPVLVPVFGVRAAVPILTVAQLIGNGSRIWFNRTELNWKVVAWFALGGVPMALAGGLLFAKAPVPARTRLLGACRELRLLFQDPISYSEQTKLGGQPEYNWTGSQCVRYTMA